jgi:Na+-driven multidrug efflux pump
MKSIIKLSLPVSFQNIFILVGFLVFLALIGFIGTLYQAATQAVISIIFIALLPFFAFGIAAQTLVGNNIGIKNFRDAEKFGIETLKLILLFTFGLALIFILFPKILLYIITTDQVIISTAIPALKIAGIAQIFYGVAIVLAYILQAAGMSFFVMKAEVLTNWLIFLPLAFLSSVILKLGFVVTWISLPIYILIYAAILFNKFYSGEWIKNSDHD